MNVGIPYGKNLQGTAPVDAPGTITRVDSTTKRPIAPDEPCTPSTRLGCGTFPLTGKPVASVNGHDSRRIALRVVINYEPGRECLIGGVEPWGGPRAVVGGNRVGEMLFDMPKPSAFRRRRVVRLRERTHKRSTFSDPGDVESNDITRKATVTFKRL